MRSYSKAFTIVELLIVVVIVGILATLTLVTYNGVQSRARDASLQSDARQAATLLANELTVSGAYPNSGTEANGGKGLPRSNGNTYIYTPNNGANPPNYSLNYSNPSSTNTYAVTNLNPVPTLVTGSAPIVTNPSTPYIGETGGCGGGYYDFGLYATATGSPTPTIQWQRMSPKNTRSGSWSNITGGTTNYYVHVDNTMIEGDYRLFRAIFTSGAFTATSPTLEIMLTNGC